MKYPKTLAARELWSYAVKNHRTDASFKKWLKDLPLETYLGAHGFRLSKRDRQINRLFDGAWQVTEHYIPGTISDDASNGPWAIVGDDKDQLIAEALDQINAWHPKYERKT